LLAGNTSAPTISITSPASGATVSGTITVTTNATDDVRVAGVQFLVDGQAYGTEVQTWPFNLAVDTTKFTNGAHGISARARDANGNATTSATITVTVANGASGGSVSGAVTTSKSLVNLTTEGNVDWIHWGDSSTPVRKAGVTAQISNYTLVGAGPASGYYNDPRPMSWSDGTPTPSSTNDLDGLYVAGIGNGFSFTAPADTTSRTLVVHVGGWISSGTLKAHLSDGSAADYVNTTALATGQFDCNYTLIYRAKSAGQKMTITWTMSSGNGNVSLNAAALTNPSGSLTGTANSSNVDVNLTTEGSIDWVHWGDGATPVRKAGVTAQLSTYTTIGSALVYTYSNDPRAIDWSDGTPNQKSNNDKDGLYVFGIGNGFSFTAPADTTTRTFIVHVGGWLSGGTLTAHLSDGSAADFTDTTSAVSAQYDRNYTLTYRAKSAGQKLTVTWMMTSGTGNVTLNAVALH